MKHLICHEEVHQLFSGFSILIEALSQCRFDDINDYDLPLLTLKLACWVCYHFNAKFTKIKNHASENRLLHFFFSLAHHFFFFFFFFDRFHEQYSYSHYNNFFYMFWNIYYRIDPLKNGSDLPAKEEAIERGWTRGDGYASLQTKVIQKWKQQRRRARFK